MFKRKKEDGTYETFGLFSDEGCTLLTDIFPDGRTVPCLRNLGLDAAKEYKTASLAALARVIALDFIEMMVNDVVDTGNVYKMPVRSGAFFKIVTKSPMEVQIATQFLGRYTHVDLIETDFRIYEMVIDYYRFKVRKRRYVQLPLPIYKRLVAHANAGKHYGDRK